MSTTSKGSESLVKDIDDTTDQTPGTLDGLGSVEGEFVTGTIEDTVPLPADSGKSLLALTAAWLGGALLSFFVAKGWMTTEQSAQFAPAITVAVVAGVSYVTARFLKSRSDVKVEALKAHATIMGSRAMAVSGGPHTSAFGAGPMGGFGGLTVQSVLGMLATANTMLNFLPLDTKTKAIVRKSINSAVAAIKEYQNG